VTDLPASEGLGDTRWVDCPDCDCCSLGSNVQPDPALVCDLCRVSSPHGAGVDGCPCDPENAAAPAGSHGGSATPTGDGRGEIARRVEELTQDRAWPWQQPGAAPTVALDDAGNVVEVRVDDAGNVTEHPVKEQP
jgi:hypothetical protein